ncbi:unnamed protein product [Blepharisma stoltei]|uniref:Uncharacterized protein n=1 Tax=Blepharisma stoltei TaxID=1481888 RepID=A0AAU9JY31_9CILI|nr:unnamed protein product [Blepharisma stoltei]
MHPGGINRSVNHEELPKTYSVWRFVSADENKRIGSAPGPSVNPLVYYPQKVPASSQKYSVNSMNSLSGIPFSHGNNKVSMRGSGWNSSQIGPIKTNTVIIPDIKPKTAKYAEDIKRPVTFGFKIARLEEPNEAPASREVEQRKLRPPSRHKDPPKALGLYLPPGTCTPPDTHSSMSEKFWNLKSGRGKSRNREKRIDPPMTALPVSEVQDRPTTQGRPRTKIRIQGPMKSPAFDDNMFKRPASGKLYDVPIIINRDEKMSRRVLSANLTAGRQQNIRPPSFKPSAQFHSSLDSGFLSLFNV